MFVSAALKDAGYEKVKMYLSFSARVYSEVCSNPDPGLGTYRVLYRNSQYFLSLTLCGTGISKRA